MWACPPLKVEVLSSWGCCLKLKAIMIIFHLRYQPEQKVWNSLNVKIQH